MTRPCAAPLDPAVLADYWLAALPPADEDSVEEHLFACDECGGRLRETIALVDVVRRLAREGALRMIVSDAFVKHAAQHGVRVREYSAPAGGRIACTVSGDDNLLIARLTADLTGAKRVDLAVCDAQGQEQLRLRDIPLETGATSVLYQESMTYAKAAPTASAIMRLLEIADTGAERLLGEYTFNHTRTIPGPAAW